MLSGPPASLAASTRPRQIASSGTPRLAEDLRDPLVGHDGEQAVRAEQVALARRRRDVRHVHFRILAARQRAGDDVAPRMLARRARRQRAGPHLFLDPGVIVR